MNILARALGVTVAVIASSAIAAAQPTDMTPREADLYAAAKTEGSVTWYVSQFNTEVADTVCRLFVARYPGVACNAIRATGQVVFQRLMQEIGASALQADVFSTNDIAQLRELKRDEKLAEYTPENLQHIVASVREYGEPGYWVTTSIAPYAIAYNTNLVSEDEAPKNWTDLADPKWINQIAIPHPGFSGSAGTWVIAMRDLYGWEFFENLEANKPQIGRSVADGVNLVVAGERKVAIVPLNRAVNEAEKGGPVAAVYPTDGMLVTPGSTGIMKDSPHPNAAKLFSEFSLSKDVSEFYATDQRFSLRDDVSSPDSLPSLGELKLILVPDEKVVDELPEVQNMFRDTFGI